MLPYLSVVIPVRNARKVLPGLLDQLLEQNYPPELYEILVVDGASTDGTPELVRRRYSHRRVRVGVLECPNVRVSAARNTGIRAASGDAMLFLSGHCTIPSKNLLADTAEILETTGAGCLCRPQPLTAPASTHMGEAIAHARATRIGRGPDAEQIVGFVDPPSTGCTYRRGVFDEVGLFDESFETCAGLDFNERVRQAGIRGYSDPRLTVNEQPPQKLEGLLRESFRYGRGMSRFMRKYPQRSSVADIAPLGILLAVLLALFAWSQLSTLVAGVVTLPIAIVPVAVLLASMQIGVRHGFRSAWRAPFVFATIYFGQGIGLLFEYAFPADSGKKNAAQVMTIPGSAEALRQADHVA
jgi:succinoglycan biosynthesis protein ExoA